MAVTAPRSVEVHQPVIGALEHLSEGVRRQNLQRRRQEIEQPLTQRLRISLIPAVHPVQTTNYQD